MTLTCSEPGSSFVIAELLYMYGELFAINSSKVLTILGYGAEVIHLSLKSG